MKRKNFMLTALATLPLSALETIRSIVNFRNDKGFKVASGEARFGKHYRMKGITLNVLDIKISGKDSDNDLAVFEQTGLTPKGGPPLHLHPNQDEWMYVVEGEYLFQVGEEKIRHEIRGHHISSAKSQARFCSASEKAKMIVSYFPAGKWKISLPLLTMDIAPNQKKIL